MKDISAEIEELEKEQQERAIAFGKEEKKIKKAIQANAKAASELQVDSSYAEASFMEMSSSEKIRQLSSKQESRIEELFDAKYQSVI